MLALLLRITTSNRKPIPIGGELGLTLYNTVQDFKGPDMILSQHQLDLRKEFMAS